MPSKKRCSPSKIVNPVTKRCVNKNGRLGQTILKNRKKKCNKSQIINPVTGRCVKRTGSVGRKLLSTSKSPQRRRKSSHQRRRKSKSLKMAIQPPFRVTPLVQRDLFQYLAKPIERQDEKQLAEKYGSEFLNIIKPYYVSKVIGKGSFGKVFLLCNDEGKCQRVVKVQLVKNEQMFLNEVELQQQLSSVGLTPELYGVHLLEHNNKKFGIIIMDKIDIIAEDLLKTSLDKQTLQNIYSMIEKVIQLFCKYNIIHGDLHWQNIAFYWDVKDNHVILRPSVLDFGWGKADQECFPQLEISQLLRTLGPGYSPIHQFNRNFLEDKLYKLFKKYEKGKVPKRWQSYDVYFNKAHDYYQHAIYFR